MDGVAPRSESDLTEMFTRAFLSWAGAPHDKYGHHAFMRSLARKLAAHFDLIGWPSTQEEALEYVRDAIERYG